MFLKQAVPATRVSNFCVVRIQLCCPDVQWMAPSTTKLTVTDFKKLKRNSSNLTQILRKTPPTQRHGSYSVYCLVSVYPIREGGFFCELGDSNQFVFVLGRISVCPCANEDLELLMSRALSGCPLDGPEHNKVGGDQLEEVKPEGDTNPEKGLEFLTHEEKSRLLAVPDFLKDQIGFYYAGKPDKITVIRFFERYAQQSSDNCDHHFETQTVQGGPAYQTRLVTPSLYGWTFVGYVCANKSAAETSACCAFWNDCRVQEIASKVPPTSTKIKKCVTSQLKGPFKKSLQERGISLALLTKEARDAIFLKFKDMGCRLALWDGNA